MIQPLFSGPWASHTLKHERNQTRFQGGDDYFELERNRPDEDEFFVQYFKTKNEGDSQQSAETFDDQPPLKEMSKKENNNGGVAKWDFQSTCRTVRANR